MISHDGFNFNFSYGWWYRITFHCLFSIHISTSLMCLLASLAYFLNWVVYFLIFEFWRLFIFSGYKSFIGYLICKYDLSSLTFYSVFLRVKILNFEEIKFIFFKILWIMLQVSCLRPLCLTSGHEDFLLCFIF